MKLLSKTITFNEKELEAALKRLTEGITKLDEKLESLEQFEDDVRDVMDFMPHDEHYIGLNDALDRLSKRRIHGGNVGT